MDLEKFFGTKVFLDLRVKVNAAWRDNDRVLDDIGVPKTEGKARSTRPPKSPSRGRGRSSRSRS
jgi:hypothetical protein